MSSEKYATEENIRSLIVLIREELKKYVPKSEYGTGGEDGPGSGPGTGDDMNEYISREEMEEILSEYVSWTDLNNILDDIVGGESNVRFEKVYSLPEVGVPNVIYLLYGEGSASNTCDEYIWDQDDYRFEMLGPKDANEILDGEPSGDYVTQEQLAQAISEIPTLSIEKIYVLPDSGEPNKLYLLSNEGTDGTNMYDEYIYDTDEARFEKLGSLTTSPEE